jgi:hypothetical protein
VTLPPDEHVPLNFDALETMPIESRKHLVQLSNFAHPIDPGASFADFWDSLPQFLAANALIELSQHIAKARKADRQVVFAIGGHVIKVGLAPILIDLVQKGFITAIAANGAVAIHDLELAMIGETSELVAETIADGRFGMIRETGQIFARIMQRARKERLGFGRAIAEELDQGENYPYRDHSLIYQAVKAGIPLTVHVAIGNDTIHAAPGLSGEDVGAATYRDFRIFANVITELAYGAFVNVGSAVILPEVFLKSVSIARNLGHKLPGVVSANLDMIQHYRPTANVLTRPVARGIAITGHHEINLPLLRLGIILEASRL